VRPPGWEGLSAAKSIKLGKLSRSIDGRIGEGSIRGCELLGELIEESLTHGRIEDADSVGRSYDSSLDVVKDGDGDVGSRLDDFECHDMVPRMESDVGNTAQWHGVPWCSSSSRCVIKIVSYRA